MTNFHIPPPEKKEVASDIKKRLTKRAAKRKAIVEKFLGKQGLRKIK